MGLGAFGIRHGILDFKTEIGNVPEIEMIFTYTVANDGGELSIDPSITVSAGILNWDLGDASTSVDSNDPSHNYSTGSIKTIKVFPGTTEGSSAITGININMDNIVGIFDVSNLYNIERFELIGNPSLNTIITPVTSNSINRFQVYNNNLTGTLDILGLTGLGGDIALSYNYNLNNILFPSSNETISSLYIDYCGLIGTLDISGLTGLGGGFISIHNNPSLNNIIFPIISNYISLLIYACDISGTLDLSPLTGLGGLEVYNNPNLTEIINPESNEEIGTYDAHDCNLTGTLDVADLTQLGDIFDVHNNPNLTEIIFSDTFYYTFSYFDLADCNLIGNLDVSALEFGVLSEEPGDYVFRTTNNTQLVSISLPASENIMAFSEFNVNNCSLNINTIDDIFSKLNSWYSNNDPSFNLIIDAGSGGNSLPTNGWSNADLMNIQSIFVASGFDVSITINV